MLSQLRSLRVSEILFVRSVFRNGPGLSHIFFLDDVLLFVKAKESQVKCLKEILDNFCKALGLKANEAKSKVLGYAELSTQKKATFLNIVGIQFTSNIGKYFGFPIFQRQITKHDSDFIFDRINSCLADWKCKLFKCSLAWVFSMCISFDLNVMQTHFKLTFGVTCFNAERSW